MADRIIQKAPCYHLRYPNERFISHLGSCACESVPQMPRLGKQKPNPKKDKKRLARSKKAQKAVQDDENVPVEVKSYTDIDIEELKKKPNVQVINDKYIEDDPITADELRAAHEEFRSLFLALRDENPSWSEEDIREAMYTSDDAFAGFFDVAEQCATILTSDAFDEDDWKRIVDLQERVLKENLPLGEAVAEWVGIHKFNGEAMRNFKEIVENEYSGSIPMFMAGAKKDEALSKRYTELYSKQRQEQQKKRDEDEKIADMEASISEPSVSACASMTDVEA
jgi:hypothetical protein